MRGHCEPQVVSVSRHGQHRFSKTVVEQISLLANLGVEGDAHAGSTVQHRSRVTVDPTQPNLRQVHLIHIELLEELAEQGVVVTPGQLGENITTHGVDLLALPPETLLQVGDRALIKVTGLRNPCRQIEDFRSGLLSRVRVHDGQGKVVRRTGIMGVVIQGGGVRAGSPIDVRLPARPHRPLQRV